LLDTIYLVMSRTRGDILTAAKPGPVVETPSDAESGAAELNEILWRSIKGKDAPRHRCPPGRWGTW
jgi:hypothetical protein